MKIVNYTSISKKKSEVPTPNALKNTSTFAIKWKFSVGGRIKYETQLERINNQFPKKREITNRMR